MEKKILTIAMLTALFLTSCKETLKQENPVDTTEASVEKASTVIAPDTLKDKTGNILVYDYDETKDILTITLNGEKIEMSGDNTMASGNHFKNDHYKFSEWHGKSTLEKDGKVIFEVGEETMPK
jgi:protein involved in sex pheromone biosynthesis